MHLGMPIHCATYINIVVPHSMNMTWAFATQGGLPSLPLKAKGLKMLRTAGVQHWVIRDPQALCYIYPSVASKRHRLQDDFVDSDMPALAREGCQGTETAPLKTGQLSRPNHQTFVSPECPPENSNQCIRQDVPMLRAKSAGCTRCGLLRSQDGTIPQQVQCLLASWRAVPPLPKSPDGHAPNAPTSMLSFLPISMNAFPAVCAECLVWQR